MTYKSPWEFKTLGVVVGLCSATLGHIAAWTKGMYCQNGTVPGVDDPTTNQIVNPLYQARLNPSNIKCEDSWTTLPLQLSFNEWWMHHVDKCDEFPPAPGDYLQLPAIGVFTVEHAVNRAFTTLSFEGNYIGTYPDGKDHPDLGDSGECITNPNIHTTNESMAAGTAFAISYTSNLSEVKPDNLIVFSVLYNTPWRRLATYSVPRLPPCPEGGCICVWGWVPNGCGEPNMYMQPFRCNVTGRIGTKKVAVAKPPVWCEGDKSACTKGAKQMIFWNQKEGNNIEVSGTDRSGMNKAPTYNMKLGFVNGPQNDIFEDEDGSFSPGPSAESSVRLLWEPTYQDAVFAFMFTAGLMTVGLLL